MTSVATDLLKYTFARNTANTLMCRLTKSTCILSACLLVTVTLQYSYTYSYSVFPQQNLMLSKHLSIVPITDHDC